MSEANRLGNKSKNMINMNFTKFCKVLWLLLVTKNVMFPSTSNTTEVRAPLLLLGHLFVKETFTIEKFTRQILIITVFLKITLLDFISKL